MTSDEIDMTSDAVTNVQTSLNHWIISLSAICCKAIATMAEASGAIDMDMVQKELPEDLYQTCLDFRTQPQTFMRLT